MTRATRFAATATFVSVLYFLFLYEYFSVPLLSSETATQILPTVCFDNLKTSRVDLVLSVALVVLGFVWRIFPGKLRLGVVLV